MSWLLAFSLALPRAWSADAAETAPAQVEAPPLEAAEVTGPTLHALEQDQDRARPLTAARLPDGSVLGVACGRVGAQVQCAGYRDGQRVGTTMSVRHDDALLVTVDRWTLRAPLPHEHSSERSLTRAFGPLVATAEGLRLDGSLLPEQVDPAVFSALL